MYMQLMRVLLILLFLFISSNPAWCAYSYYRSVVIDHTKVPNTDQTQFPILVCGNGSAPCNSSISGLNQSGGGAHVQNSNGYDIVFGTDTACSSLLTWEMEKYTSSTGEFYAWVTNTGTPLSHTVDTTFYMCYGNAAISTFQSTASAVWDSNYKAVYHMSDNAANTTVNESTGVNTGTNSANTSTKTITGAIGGGLNYAGSDYTNIASNASLNITGSITLEYWTKRTSTGIAVIYGAYGATGMGLATGVNANGNSEYYSSTNGNWKSSTSNNYNSGSWVSAAVKVVSTTATFYKNGSTDGTQTTAVPATYTGQRVIAAYIDDTINLTSQLDEFRISATGRSDDWITTEYNNESSPSTFYTVGPEISPNSTHLNLINGVSLIRGVSLLN